jgi:5-methylcytosine-specific restriction endonuclease McrA
MTPLQLKSQRHRRGERAGNAHYRTLKRTKNVTCSLQELKDWFYEHADDPCAECGGVAAHIDHIIPLAKGGEHGIGNLQMLCATCNSRKSHWLPGEVKTWPNAKNLRNRKVAA